LPFTLGSNQAFSTDVVYPVPCLAIRAAAHLRNYDGEVAAEELTKAWASRAALLALLASAMLLAALPAAPTAAQDGPNRCKVPNVHGLTVAKARPRLIGAGCGLGHVRPNGLGPKAVTIAESPEVGAVLPRYSKVTLFVRLQ
jgi:hypothetical protein